MTLPDAAAAAVLTAAIVFARLGSALLAMPAFGDVQVPGRVRLLIALACTAVLAPLVAPSIRPPAEPALLALLVTAEIVLGLAIGLAARLVLGALHVAGTAMAFQSGLAAAAFFDPSEASQRTLFVTYLVGVVVPVMLASDAHHWLLQGLVGSYDRLPPGAPLPVDDLAELFARLTGTAFAAGIQIAMPILAIGLLVNIGFGILSRLMPTLQALIVAIPVQVLLGLLATIAALATSVAVALRLVEQTTAWLR
jgi:flagellar biosynthetic protein FliR